MQLNKSQWGKVFLPLSIPALSTVHTPLLSTLLWQGVLVGGRMPTLLQHPPGCHGNSHSASVSLYHSWHYTVEQRRKVKKVETKKRHMEWKCDRTTNLGPGTKSPLGFVALVGGDFGPWGNRVAAGTLGQFTILWKGGHIHPFMQWLTKWKYCNNICPWPQNTTNIRHSSSHKGQSLTKLNYIPSALRLSSCVSHQPFTPTLPKQH